jgi:hypothetical protein
MILPPEERFMNRSSLPASLTFSTTTYKPFLALVSGYPLP